MPKLREKVKIWDRELTLRNSPMTFNLYRQEFDSSLMKDLTELMNISQIFDEPENINDDPEDFNDVDINRIGEQYEASEEMVFGILKVVYIMNKTEHRKDKDFPDYEDWLEEFENFELIEIEWFERVFGVIEDAFFPDIERGGTEKASKTD